MAPDLERNLQVDSPGQLKSNFCERQARIPRPLSFSIAECSRSTAADLEVVRGMPEARRRFLDRGICFNPAAYLQTIADYSRVVKQKNKLLQQASENEFSLEKVSQILSRHGTIQVD